MIMRIFSVGGNNFIAGVVVYSRALYVAILT
jgi:hypothetical protein